MKRYLICLLSLLLLSGASTATFAKGQEIEEESPDDDRRTRQKQSEYDKLFKDKKVKTSKGGIMTLHIVDDKLLVELPLKMLNRDMMLMSSVAEITDHTDSYVGLSPLRPLQVKFDTINRTVLLRRDRSQSVVADNGEEIRRALAQSNMPAILGSYKIKAFNADSTAVVFDMTDLFIGGESLLTAIDPRSETKLVLRGVSFNQKKDRSLLTDVAAFDDNATVTSYITYDSKIGKTYNKVTTAKLVRSLALLPETPMRPRLADFRLPLNVLGKYNYHSDYKLMNPVYFATRWRMEPSDQAAYDRAKPWSPRPRGFLHRHDLHGADERRHHEGHPRMEQVFRGHRLQERHPRQAVPHARRGPAVQPPELPATTASTTCLRSRATPACAPTSIPAAARFSARRSWSATT